jgi:acyl dehydratase
MPFDAAWLTDLPARVTRHDFSERDTMLYALGVGAGASPDDLPYVYEEGLIALPTMAVMLGYPGFWQKEPQYGIDWRRVLHAEQSIRFHAPLPVSGTVRSDLAFEQVVDKGAAKGALLRSRRTLYDDADDRLLATVWQTSFLRGDGGCGTFPADAVAPEPFPVPDLPADATYDLPTRPEQALIYRLSGDYNPLHADPEVARSAGLERPILHGLCTYGIVGRALVRELCGDDPARLRQLDCRFTSPVYPGDWLRLSVWRFEAGAAFRVDAPERAAMVINNGYAEIEA